MNREHADRLVEIEKMLAEALLPDEHRKAVAALHDFLEEIIQSAQERRARQIIMAVWRGRLTAIAAIVSALALFRKELLLALEMLVK